MENDILYHHGIRGQKWGVRRYQNADGTLTAVGKRRQKTPEQIVNDAIVQERRTAGKNRRMMSSEELTNRINRIKLENEFKKLNDDDVNAGQKYVTSALKDAGKKVLTNAMAGAMAYTAKVALEKTLGKDAASYMAPNPNSGGKKKK